MVDINKLLGQLMSSGAAGGFAGGLAGGLAGSLLTSKSGRKLGKKAIKMGGVVAVGALAYAAYQRCSAGRAATPHQLPKSGGNELSAVPEGSAFLPPKTDEDAQEQLGLALIRAMIAASRADGRLDPIQAGRSQYLYI